MSYQNQQQDPYAYQPQYNNTAPYSSEHQPVMHGYAADSSASTANSGDETAAMLIFIIGWFIAGFWLWLIGWLMYRNSPNPGARKWAKINGIMCLIGTILFFLSCGAAIIYGIVMAIAMR